VSPSGVEQIRRTGVRTVCAFVVGTVLEDRPARVSRKRGWSPIRFDADAGGFIRARGGSLVRTARYAHLGERSMSAMGAANGEPFTSQRELAKNPGPVPPRVYGPVRESYRGELGGLNFQPATFTETARAISAVLDQHPGCVIVDGSDDWDAPEHVQIHELLCDWGIRPVAWWHTGVSGATPSGAVLTPEQYEAFAAMYVARYGARPEFGRPGDRPFPPERPSCGCYGGEGLLVRTP